MLTHRQTDRHTEMTKTIYPLAYFVCQGYKYSNSYVLVFSLIYCLYEIVSNRVSGKLGIVYVNLVNQLYEVFLELKITFSSHCEANI